MTRRTVIDPSQPWAMRVSTPGRDVLSDGGPYLFDGSLETIQIHASGIVSDVFNWQNISTPQVARAVSGSAGSDPRPELSIGFSALGYVPHIEWGITSDALGGGMDFPGRHVNQLTSGTPGDTVVTLPVAMIPLSSSFKLIATTRNSGLLNGAESRQGDLYYTVFKRPTS